MATFTTNYSLRKPATSDLVTVATDIGANMDLIDTILKRLDDRIQTGTKTTGVHVVDTTLTTAVVFPTVFSAVPKVFLTGKNDPVNVNYEAQVQNETTAGFDLLTARDVGTGALDVNWVAINV